MWGKFEKTSDKAGKEPAYYNFNPPPPPSLSGYLYRHKKKKPKKKRDRRRFFLFSPFFSHPYLIIVVPIMNSFSTPSPPAPYFADFLHKSPMANSKIVVNVTYIHTTGGWMDGWGTVTTHH